MTDVSWMEKHAFPYTRECVYLNTAATGLASLDAGKEAQSFYQTVLLRGFDAHDEWQAVAREVATSVASFIGAPDAQVDFFSSTTHALNLVAQGIRWADDDEVVFAADEHPSVREPWYAVPGKRLRAKPVAIADEANRQALLIEAMSSRTRVLAVSHVHSQSGTRMDLRALGRACSTNGTLLIVDGIQGVGAVPVDAHGVDVYCAATFKWLLSGFGLAFLATSDNARRQLSPAFRGYRNLAPSQELQYSHLNYPALYVLRRNLALFQAYRDQIYGRVAELIQAVKIAMRAHGETVITPLAAEQSAGIVSVRVADAETAQAIRIELALRQISVAARGDVVRISPHFYNAARDVDLLSDAWQDIRS